jgi:hypothetical protein
MRQRNRQPFGRWISDESNRLVKVVALREAVYEQ